MPRTLFAFALAAAAAAVACATNPATGQRQLSFMSEEKEIALGQENDAQVRQEMGSYDDRALQEYVTTVGMKLAQVSERPNLPWHFTVADVPAVNAFALPGGYIYITRGILPFLDDESQLAGVLGHEIGHVTARHAASQYSKSTLSQVGLLATAVFAPGGGAIAQAGGSGLGLLLLKNSRDDEAQADGPRGRGGRAEVHDGSRRLSASHHRHRLGRQSGSGDRARRQLPAQSAASGGGLPRRLEHSERRDTSGGERTEREVVDRFGTDPPFGRSHY
jgi:hypothetical protein